MRWRCSTTCRTGGPGSGDPAALPPRDDHPLRPASPYGVSKTAAERYLDCWAGLTGGRALTVRLANVFGPRQDPAGEAGVVAIFASRLLGGDRCIVNGDGEQTRDYVYVGDVADAVARAVASPDAVGGANIGTGAETTVNEIYRHLPQPTRVTGPAAPL